MKHILMSLVLVSILFSSFCFSQDKETEARKLYLQASRLVRAEDFQAAEKLLNTLLSDYLDTEVALKADELLNSLADKLKAETLPKTPGFYILLTGGQLIKLEKLVMREAAYQGRYINYATFKLHQVLQHYADEVDRFYIYNPKARLSQIKLTVLTTQEVAEGSPPSDNYIINEGWYINTVQGRFTDDDVIYTQISPGMFEIRLSENFSPLQTLAAGFIDGSGYVAVTLINQKMIDAMYPGLELWQPENIKTGTQAVKSLLRRYPHKPELYLFSGIWSYKQAYLEARGQNKAKEIALKGLEIASADNTTPSKVSTHLQMLLDQCRLDSVIAISADETQLLSQIEALNKFGYTVVNYSNHRWFMAKAWIYSRLGDYQQALEMCNLALKGFKTYGEKGRSFLGTKLSFKLGNQPEPGFQIQKVLNNFSKTYKKWVEKSKKYIESEQILAQVEQDFIADTGDPKKGLKLVDKARKKDKKNEHVYLARAALYEKLGDQKKMKKALKEAEKVRQEKEKSVRK